MQASDNPRKRLFRRLTQWLSLIGIVIVAIPFFSTDDRSATPVAPLSINIADMQEGEWRSLVWNGWPVFILKRSPEMLVHLRTPTETLIDPWSKHSRQPENASNVYRSVRPAFFVSYLGCSSLNCPLRYEAILSSDTQQPPAQLVCSCSNSRYDLAGRVYSGSDDNKNLHVPEYDFPEPGILRLTDK
jgi:ubiquinol-cytochrome c reductase iron-sulfur subunit